MSTVVLRPRTATLAAAALVVAVCALTLTLMPTPLVLPVLVGVAGWSAAQLALGPRTGPAPHAASAGGAIAAVDVTVADDASGDPALGGSNDALLRATLPVVLGVLALLGSVLLAAALGWRIDTPAITVAAGLVALALLGAARWRTLLPTTAAERPETADAPRRESGYAVSKTTTRRVVGGARVVAAGLVLAAATAAAVALRPVPVERYTQLALDPGVALAGAPVAARPDAPVTLAWSLAGYGGPQDGPPPVAVTVGGAAARDLRVAVEPPSAADPTTGPVDVRPGTVTFRAPATEGLYPVHVTVAGSTIGATLEVSR